MNANWTGRKSSPTALSPRQKKGFGGRQDQTRKGYKAYGGGRRPGCASRSRTCLGVAARVHIDRIDTRASGRPSCWPRATSQESRTADLRSSCRQRRAAASAEASRNRTDLPHRCNKKVKTQDGRCLRRYRRRWKIERTIAW